MRFRNLILFCHKMQDPVKAISEKARVKTPGFLGYLIGFSLPMLVPILVVVGWVMLRGGYGPQLGGGSTKT